MKGTKTIRRSVSWLGAVKIWESFTYAPRGHAVRNGEPCCWPFPVELLAETRGAPARSMVQGRSWRRSDGRVKAGCHRAGRVRRARCGAWEKIRQMEWRARRHG